ncbi:hypothetical protein ACJX0J_026566 [Zea mays]
MYIYGKKICLFVIVIESYNIILLLAFNILHILFFLYKANLPPIFQAAVAKFIKHVIFFMDSRTIYERQREIGKKIVVSPFAFAFLFHLDILLALIQDEKAKETSTSKMHLVPFDLMMHSYFPTLNTHSNLPQIC